MSALLRVQGLTLAAAGRTLLHGLGFEAHAGERWCVIGRNAAGKSTLLRALAGLAVPHREGVVELGGDPRALHDVRRAALLRAYLPQTPDDRFDLPVRALLALHAGVPPGAQAQLDARALAGALDIGDLLDRAVTRLSGGERQRAGLAAVAARGVPLWLLDEPVSFQDPAHQQLVARWLRGQASMAAGRAMVMSAHDMNWVQAAATHVIAILPGGECACGPVAEVLNAQVLRETFACEWRQADGAWLMA